MLGDDVSPHFLPCPFPSTLPFSGRDGDSPSPTTKLGQPSPTSTLCQSPTPAHAFPSKHLVVVINKSSGELPGVPGGLSPLVRTILSPQGWAYLRDSWNVG